MTTTRKTEPAEPAASPDAPVLIVGGSLVGLSTAAFLAHHGIACTLVERHPGTSIHPRAVGYYPRTGELLRQIGVEDAALAEAVGYETHRTRAGVTSLAGEVLFSREEMRDENALGDLTPSRLLMLPQDRLEPLLRERATELGADLCFGTELLSFAEDPDGVTAVLADGSGVPRRFRSSYLVACDGPRSIVRESLKVPRTGRGVLSHHVSIAFTADLTSLLGEARYSVVHVKNPQVAGILVHDDTLTGGTLIVDYRPDRGERLADFTDARCTELVAAALGSTEAEVGIRSRLPWDMAEHVAEDFAHGRVFLAGDAAHVVPPTGGYGANTGIADAHNLAWKLALVLRGTADPALLDSYDAERRPVAAFTARQGSLQLAARSGTATDEEKAETVDEVTVTMGQSYRSAAILPEAGAAPAMPVADPRTLAGAPGTRAPYVPLERDGLPLSTLDLFGRGFVLLAGGRGNSWVDAARRPSGPEVAAFRVGAAGSGADLTDLTGQGWTRAYGVRPDGAVLVRPDGFVGWRSAGGAAGKERAVLAAALDALLGTQSRSASR